MASEGGRLRVLVLEPYYGGSHRAFIDGLLRNLPCDFELLALPPRRWKWRMRFAAPYFAEQIAKQERSTWGYDLVLCSSLIDVAALRALLPAPLCALPVLTYFHENQFAYPVQAEDERDLHFGVTNLISALASEAVAFNSRYNLDTFLAGCAEILGKCPDMRLPGVAASIREKASVLPPPIDTAEIDAARPPAGIGTPAHPPVIVWNHRWEHDKNPEEFFAALRLLDRQGAAFSLVVLGASFREVPAVFAQAKAELAHRILHWGHAESRRDYVAWLKAGDLVVSTARHEFFGLAVLEAVRAGCRPVLPDRLTYPELFPAEYLYGEGDLCSALREALPKRRLEGRIATGLTEHFSWQVMARLYLSWFYGARAGQSV